MEITQLQYQTYLTCQKRTKAVKRKRGEGRGTREGDLPRYLTLLKIIPKIPSCRHSYCLFNSRHIVRLSKLILLYSTSLPEPQRKLIPSTNDVLQKKFDDIALTLIRKFGLRFKLEEEKLS